MNRRITILCSSFPPETGAAPGRMWHLATLLRTAGNEVTVITSMPNYPTGRIFPGYRGKLTHREEREGIKIYRSWLVPSNSNNRAHRALSLLSYVGSLLILAFPRLIRTRPELLILSSPPFVTGYFGLLLARFTAAKTLLNVSDLWPQSALDLGFLQQGAFYRLLQRLEQRMYRRAGAISVQSEEIARHIRVSAPVKQLFLYRNLQDEFPQALQPRAAGQRKIVYAGLLGVAQGVYGICRAIDFAALGTELHIYGSGNETELIKAWIQQPPGCGIYYHGSEPANRIPDLLTQYHLMLIPLQTSIHGAVPSKIFNAMANGLPILFSGNGEAATIIRQTRTGLVNAAGDYEGLQQNIKQYLSLSEAAYEVFRDNCHAAMNSNFNRSIQDKAFIDFVEGMFS